MFSSTIICLPSWHMNQLDRGNFPFQISGGEPSPQSPPPRLTSPVTPTRLTPTRLTPTRQSPDADTVDTDVKHNYVTSQILSLEGAAGSHTRRTPERCLKQTSSDITNLQNGHHHEIHELRGSVSDSTHCNSHRHTDSLLNGSLIPNGHIDDQGHLEGHQFTRSNGHHSDLDLDTVDSHSKLRSPCLHGNDDVITNSTSKIHKDGAYYLQIVDDHERRLAALVAGTEADLQGTADIPDDACGVLRTTAGKTNLVIHKKFPHFRKFCNRNLHPSADEKETTDTDLEGLWAIVAMQIDDIHDMYTNIDNMRKSGWVLPKDSPQQTPVSSKTRAARTPHSGRTPHSKKTPGRDHTDSASKARDEARSKAREEARKRLIAAKKAGRQRKASQSDEVEIYVPS